MNVVSAETSVVLQLHFCSICRPTPGLAGTPTKQVPLHGTNVLNSLKCSDGAKYHSPTQGCADILQSALCS
jgi:hypothetical protein